MRIYDRGPRGHYEEALRSLGLLLDAQEYRHILLAETDDGFLVNALRFSPDLTRTGMGGGGWQFVSTHFSDDDTAGMLDAAHARRVTAHRALNYERSLRLVGHWVDSLPASRVAILDQNGTLMVRALPQASTDPPFVVAQFTPDALAAMEAAGDQDHKPRRWGR